MKKFTTALLPLGVANDIKEYILENDAQDLLDYDIVESKFNEGKLVNFFNYFALSDEANKNCTLLFMNFSQIIDDIVNMHNEDMKKSFGQFKDASEKVTSEMVAVGNENELYNVTSLFDYNGEKMVALHDEKLDIHFVLNRSEVDFIRVTDSDLFDEDEDEDYYSCDCGCEDDFDDMYGDDIEDEFESDEEFEHAFASLIEELNKRLNEEVEQDKKSLEDEFNSLIDELIAVSREKNNYNGDDEFVNMLEEQIISTVKELFKSIDNDEDKTEMIKEMKQDIAKAKLQ